MLVRFFNGMISLQVLHPRNVTCHLHNHQSYKTLATEEIKIAQLFHLESKIISRVQSSQQLKVRQNSHLSVVIKETPIQIMKLSLENTTKTKMILGIDQITLSRIRDNHLQRILSKQHLNRRRSLTRKLNRFKQQKLILCS